MAQKDNILFDLDGTLTDPRVGITTSVQYALAQFGIVVEDPDTLCPFIGPPLRDTFTEEYGFSPAQADEAVQLYREQFARQGIFENQLYPGIASLLASLQNAGRTLLLATSKPAVFAQKILTHFSLDKYFHFVGGSELDGTREKKEEVIAHVLQSCRITDLSRCVMVGDRKYDVLGAKAVGIDCMGVLFGYGSREELESAGATWIVPTVEKLNALLHRL